MTRYWLDTEFIEDGVTIDLISIGIVAEDGRELYLLNYDCDHSKASQWVKENVLASLPPMPLPCYYPTGKAFLESEAGSQGWRNKGGIAYEILEFCDPQKYGKPEFWGEWASYDWVCFCQLFGTMMDLPDGFPMRIRDVIQWAEDHLGIPSDKLPPSLETEGNHNALLGAHTVKQRWEFLKAIEEQAE